MSPSVVCRPLKKQDYVPLAGIVDAIWRFSSICGEDYGRTGSLEYLYNICSRSAFIEVAEVDGKTAGAIMVYLGGSSIKHYSTYFHKISCDFRMMFCKQIRTLMNFGNKYDGVCDDIADKVGASYDAEIKLFIMDKGFRGLGLGRSLYEHALKFIKDSGAESFRLFTDDSCNYGFYDHMGLARRGEAPAHIDLGGNDLDLKLFMYDNVGPDCRS